MGFSLFPKKQCPAMDDSVAPPIITSNTANTDSDSDTWIEVSNDQGQLLTKAIENDEQKPDTAPPATQKPEMITWEKINQLHLYVFQVLGTGQALINPKAALDYSLVTFSCKASEYFRRGDGNGISFTEDPIEWPRNFDPSAPEKWITTCIASWFAPGIPRPQIFLYVMLWAEIKLRGQSTPKSPHAFWGLIYSAARLELHKVSKSNFLCKVENILEGSRSAWVLEKRYVESGTLFFTFDAGAALAPSTPARLIRSDEGEEYIKKGCREVFPTFSM